MKNELLAICVVLAACQTVQTGPNITLYKAGTVSTDRQQDLDQCKIASLQAIPQVMVTQVSGDYSNTNDVNQRIRYRYIDRCLISKGYTLLPDLPICRTQEKKQALRRPQPASSDQVTCSSGQFLDG